MTLHHRLNRSRLVLLLQQWRQSAHEPAARQDVAQRLSPWLGALDADRFNASLRALEATPAPASAAPISMAPAARPRVDPDALAQAVARVQAELQALVAAATADDLDGTDPTIDQALLNQRYQGVQRAFTQRLGALRSLVRQQLAQASPDLRRLASLDAVMEQMLLSAREPRLWGSLPAHLAQRQAAGGAPSALTHDLRTLLHAELQARLQPIVGLVEAAQHALGRRPAHPNLETA
ncbi:MAG TPA: DUF3348 family protein [Burkholderiaceae bacterium]|nr:DUF3348 family protein [Burkholderiaceae bacterium]